MGQIFNLKRFFNYAVCQLVLSKKSWLLKIGGAAVALFLFTVFLLGTEAMRSGGGWVALFLGSGVLAILLVVGSSFPALRRKGESINFLTIPASLFEKFVYEFLIKVVLFLAVYPLFFYIVSQTAYSFADFVFYKHTMIPFKFEYFNMDREKEEGIVRLIICLVVFGISLFFAGSTAFKRFPPIKTLLVIGLLIGAITGYFFILLNELHLEKGIGYFFESLFKEPENMFPWIYGFLGISSLITLAFAFFKLKEKQV